MTETYTVAKFWKCALHVNSSGYIAYRGQEHDLSEEEFNNRLVQTCKEENIKVIGLADHGNVDAVDAIRSLMNEHDIIVFPGFEISSTEKVHFVCLFSESTIKDRLNRYLGKLDLTGTADVVRPSNLGANDLIRKVNELGGFIYAAHITLDNGILKQKLNHVWSNIMLRAAQIPGAIADVPDNFKNILLNKNPDYQRERPIGIVNAKDVAIPEDLKDPSASCLIKMTAPSFQSFKTAFLDPDSRIRLNSDVQEYYYSRIERITVTGGFLDGIDINPFSDHLNAVIGGRGTGKSTLLECLRYVLDKRPSGRDAQKKHDEIIKENLGKANGRIEIYVRSSARNGQRYIISRKYPDPVIIKDESGNVSNYTVQDILPEVEIFGQNEILEIAQDKDGLFQIIQRFLPESIKGSELKIAEIQRKLEDNVSRLIKAEESLSGLQGKIAQLPKLEEEANQYKKLGVEDISKVVPKLERERTLFVRIQEELKTISSAIDTVENSLPDTIFISDNIICELPHGEDFKSIRLSFDELKAKYAEQIQAMRATYATYQTKIMADIEGIKIKIQDEESKLEKSFKTLPSLEGKSGKEIGVAYQNLLKRIEQVKPTEAQIKALKKSIEAFQQERRNILSELSELRSNRSSELSRAIKSLNKKLDRKLKITLIPEGSRKSLKDFILECNLEGIGEKRLAWIDTADALSPLALASAIRESKEKLISSNWGITPNTAEALLRLSPSQLYKLEGLGLPDLVNIELNVSHTIEQYKDIKNLSTGQQCTAILHLLMLKNRDPLIMDQPEDNLDNAFIAERIVTELRASKIERQFLFATHNANIPVFGDAEWIGILESTSDGATLPNERQGSIDSITVRDRAADILEGGKTAFLQRKEKYGYE